MRTPHDRTWTVFPLLTGSCSACPKGVIKRRGKVKHEEINEASGLIAGKFDSQ